MIGKGCESTKFAVFVVAGAIGGVSSNLGGVGGRSPLWQSQLAHKTNAPLNSFRNQDFYKATTIQDLYPGAQPSKSNSELVSTGL